MIRALTLLCLIALPATAQDLRYPAPANPYVTDLADLLSDQAEQTLTQRLKALRSERDTEMTVVTIDSRKSYGPHGSIESFATGLFNTWGIGDASRNDGILFLVARQDREMRIELGSGFGPEYDDRMANVIDHYVLPYFRKDDYEQGILASVDETIKRTEADWVAPSGTWNWLTRYWVIVALIGSLGALKFLRSDTRVRLRKCPNCGRRGLRRSRETDVEATREKSGRQWVRTRCKFCDYRDDISRVVRYSSGSSSFGGGSSSGGGATGRW